MGAISTKVEQTKQLAATTAPKNLKDYISSYTDQIAKALPKVGITPERFTRLALSALSATPQLGECSPKSFLGAMMTCAQMGMEPNTPLGEAYLIPYKNWKTGVVECQYQLGYKGLIDLAYRSGSVKTIYAEVVYKNDRFVYTRGFDAKLEHEPLISGDRGEPIAYYAVWKGENGIGDFCVMSVEDIMQHRQKFSKAKNSPWDTNFDAMAKKTVLKRLLKYAPLSIEFRQSLEADESIKSEMSQNMAEVPNEFVEAEYVVSDADDTPFIGQEVGEFKEEQ